MNPNAPFAAPSAGASRMVAEARQARQRHDYAQALQILQRADRMEPNTDVILLELGYTQALTFDFTAAERSFDHAFRVARSPIEALVAIGHHWMDVRRFQSACDAFEKVLQQSPIPVVTFVRLIELYLRLGRPDTAAAVAEQGMQLYPHHEGTMLSRAKVHRHVREFQPAETLLRALLIKADADVTARASAAYELATLLDQQARYDEAMAAFVEAKSLLRPSSARAANTLHAKLAIAKKLPDLITPAVIQRWRKFAETQLQPPRKLALLCGYPRSGTTLLEYVLDSHPQIISADETQVFQSKAYGQVQLGPSSNSSLLTVLDSISARNLRQVRADYMHGIESFLGQSIGDRLLIDKNPGLTFDIPSMCRIFPEAKFLVALRDPRDVCLSCFMQASPVLPDTTPWLTLEGTISNYASIMGLWLGLKNAVTPAAIEVRYEDLVQDLEGSARRVLEFLGFEWDPRVLQFHEHARTKTISSPTYAEVTKPIFKTGLGRWRNYQKYFEPHLEKLAPYLKAFGYDTT